MYLYVYVLCKYLCVCVFACACFDITCDLHCIDLHSDGSPTSTITTRIRQTLMGRASQCYFFLNLKHGAWYDDLVNLSYEVHDEFIVSHAGCCGCKCMKKILILTISKQLLITCIGILKFVFYPVLCLRTQSTYHDKVEANIVENYITRSVTVRKNSWLFSFWWHNIWMEINRLRLGNDRQPKLKAQDYHHNWLFSKSV